jgi:hypothetical protein
MAAPAKKRRYRLSADADTGGRPQNARLFTTPKDIDARMTPTRRAALREARLREKRRTPDAAD